LKEDKKKRRIKKTEKEKREKRKTLFKTLFRKIK